ncbi:MAG: ABC transporter permease [Armatimonadota bacterium]|nr:ABC transporter permease [Armatimonadota bacterium]
MRMGSSSAARFHSSRALLGLAIVFGASVLLSPVDRDGRVIFLDPVNLSNVSRQVAENGILSVGMTVVVLIGGIDLSVGSVMALGATLTAMLFMERQWTLASGLAVGAEAAVGALVACWLVARVLAGTAARGWVAGVAGTAVAGGALWWGARQVQTGFGVLGAALPVVCVGVLLGSLSGAIVARGKLQPFVVTLAMMSAALGLARLSSSGAARDIGFGAGAAPVAFRVLREPIGGYFPVPALFFVAAAAGVWVLLQHTRFGRHVYAIGGNEEAARLSGVFVDRAKLAAFALSGGLSALTGVIHCAQNLQGNPNDGIGLELDAIAAVVIGGTSLTGGRGSVLGTLVGVLVIGILNNIMSLRNVDANFQLILKGAIIVLTVLFQEGRFGVFTRREQK